MSGVRLHVARNGPNRTYKLWLCVCLLVSLAEWNSNYHFYRLHCLEGTSRAAVKNLKCADNILTNCAKPVSVFCAQNSVTFWRMSICFWLWFEKEVSLCGELPDSPTHTQRDTLTPHSSIHSSHRVNNNNCQNKANLMQNRLDGASPPSEPAIAAMNLNLNLIFRK